MVDGESVNSLECSTHDTTIGYADMYPKFGFTGADLKRASGALAGTIPSDDEGIALAIQVFRIANSFRASHLLPMRKMRAELRIISRKLGVDGVAAARLKRMESIRSKLRGGFSNMGQMNDLAGCRLIVPDMASVNAVVLHCTENSSHEFLKGYPYTVEPKPDGYRSHHLVFKFKGEGADAAFDGKRVEVQVRTQIQHAWATAVEAVGLFRGEDFKRGAGDADWRRLFLLMSRELAIDEGCAIEDAERLLRRLEIYELSKKLRALKTLNDLRHGFKVSESYRYDSNNKPDFYRLQFNRATGSINVRAIWKATDAVQTLDRGEVEDKTLQFDTVLVEVDSVENLRSAYPNYFGDVEAFRAKLAAIVGADDPEMIVVPQTVVSRYQPPHGDASWMRRSGRFWPDVQFKRSKKKDE